MSSQFHTKMWYRYEKNTFFQYFTCWRINIVSRFSSQCFVVFPHDFVLNCTRFLSLVHHIHRIWWSFTQRSEVICPKRHKNQNIRTSRKKVQHLDRRIDSRCVSNLQKNVGHSVRIVFCFHFFFQMNITHKIKQFTYLDLYLFVYVCTVLNITRTDSMHFNGNLFFECHEIVLFIAH